MRLATAKALFSNSKNQDIALDDSFSSSKEFGSVFKYYYAISSGKFKNNTNKKQIKPIRI